jgi:hypothetical protein
MDFLASVRRGGRLLLDARLGASGAATAGCPAFLYPRYPCKSGACHAGGSAEAGKIISAFPRRVSGNAGRSAKDPRLDRALEAPG